jgi:tetratricopeptide (TPR) repeat protein
VAARELGYRAAELFDDLGAIAQQLGERQEALAAYEQALAEASPDVAARVRTKRAWIYLKSFDPPRYDAARADLAEALRLDPAHADAHAGMGYVAALEKASGAAQREAAQALRGGTSDYLVLHKIACIYAELSQIDAGQAQQHREIALALLRDAVNLCESSGGGRQELASIRNDTSLRALSGHPDFVKLVGGKGH